MPKKSVRKFSEEFSKYVLPQDEFSKCIFHLGPVFFRTSFHRTVFITACHEIACDATVSFHMPKWLLVRKCPVMAKCGDFYPSQTTIALKVYGMSQVFRA